MDTFASQFEKMLAKEKEAARLVKDIVARGVGRTELIFLLHWATSPDAHHSFTKSYANLKDRLPSRRKTFALAAGMERLAREMEEVFGHPFYAPLSESQRLAEIARLLRTEAVTVRRFPRPRIAKLFSNKSLWKHVPLALLCRLLDVPKTCSYSEAEKLLWYAFLARGIVPKAVDRGLERQVRRFERSPAGKLLHYALLSGMPKDSPTGKLLYPLFRRIVGQQDNKYLRMARMMG
jgi:hypothetical protein